MLTRSYEYLQAVQEINDYVNHAKYRASVNVNSEILKTNLFIGNVIIRNSEWGNKFVDNLSKDMKMKYPGAKGYSVRNLKYMKKFAQIFIEDDVDKYGFARITWSWDRSTRYKDIFDICYLSDMVDMNKLRFCIQKYI